MNRKNLHVVFGRGAQGTFLQSGAFSPEDIRLVCLEDNLSVGPIYKMDSDEAINRREKWWIEISAESDYPVEEWVNGMLDNDRKVIDEVLQDADQIDEIYLWTGYCAQEMLSAARFVAQIARLGKPMFQVNFPNIPVRNIRGEVIYLDSLVITATNQVQEAAKHFYALGEKDIEAYQTLWERATSVDSLLRIPDIFPRKICHKEETYYDHFLLSHCADEFREAARVVGETLCDAAFNVDGEFLGWRLRQLCLAGKIEYRGELTALRYYEVKKATV